MNRKQELSARGSVLGAALTVALGAMAPGDAQAIRINYDVGASLLYSDNIGLSNTDPQSDTVLAPQLRFDVEQTGSTLRLNARGILQYLDYRDDTFDDGFRGSFSGQALWTMVPERLEWTFEDYLSRQPIDSFAAFTPGNEQQTNLFVTGPSLFFGLGQATRGQVDLRYSNSYAEENEEFNSDRYNLAGRVRRELSPTRSIGGSIEATTVDYDLDSVTSDYTRYDAYGTYSSQFRSVDMTIDLGYSRLEFDDIPGNEWLPLARGSLDWHLSPRTTIDARLSYQLSDAAENLVVADIDEEPPIGGGIGDPEVPVAPDVFKQRRVEVGYRFTGERLSVDVRPFYQRITYIDSLAQDEESQGGLVGISYEVRPRMTLSFVVAGQDREFQDSRKDRDLTASVALDNEFTRHWSARVELQRRERNSNVDGQDYDENAAIVSFSYRR